MKAYKKIVVGFIVVITILGLVAFYFPVRNIPQPAQTSSEPTTENYSASLSPVLPISTSSDSINQTSTPDKTKFEDMSGFADLNQESNSLDTGADGSSSNIDDIFKDLNQ